MPVARVISAATATGGRDRPVDRRPVASGLVAMNRGAGLDQADRLGDPLEAVGPGLAEHDIVRGSLGQGVAGLVQRRVSPASPITNADPPGR